MGDLSMKIAAKFSGSFREVLNGSDYEFDLPNCSELRHLISVIHDRIDIASRKNYFRREDGDIIPIRATLILVNGMEHRVLKGLSTELNEETVIHFITSVHGG